MAIKDINVMSVINQELAKMERRGGSRDYVDVISDTMRYAKEDRAWSDRKNAQMQKMLDVQSEGYKTSFNAVDSEKYYDRVDSYIDKNRGSMDEITLEYADALKRNIGDHKDRVVQFREDIDLFEASKDDWMLKANDYFDRKEPLDENDYSDIQSSIDDYVSMKNRIIENNAEFLQLPQFKHVYTGMVGQEAVINDLLAEAKDQQVFTEYEHEYLTRAMQTGNYQILEEERAKKKALQGEYMKQEVSNIAPALAKDDIYLALERGETITVPQGMTIMDTPEGMPLNKNGEDFDNSLFLSEKTQSKNELNRLNELYKTSTGDDYVIRMRGASDAKPSWRAGELKIFKDKLGLTSDQINDLSGKEGAKLMDDYAKKEGIDPDKIDPQTGEEIVDDSALPEIAALSALGFGLGQATGTNEKIAKASKMMLDETIKSGKNIMKIAKNVDVNDITHFLDDKVVQGAVEDLEGLKDAMVKAKDSGEYSKEYKDATKKYNKKVKQHAKALKSGGKIKLEGMTGVGKTLNRAIKSMTQTELEKLLRNPNKWNTIKAKRFMMKTVPGLAKGWRQFTPGGGFTSFELGRRATEKLVEQVTGEGITATAIGFGGGYASQKYAYNKAKSFISKKIAEKGGKQWLVKTLKKKIGAKAAIGLTTGVTAGGGTPLSIATGTIGALAGAGMAIWDIMEIFDLGPYSEKEGEE